jgi:cytochrome c5
VTGPEYASTKYAPSDESEFLPGRAERLDWAQEQKNPFATPEGVEQGSALFQTHCTYCHGGKVPAVAQWTKQGLLQPEMAGEPITRAGAYTFSPCHSRWI